MHEKIQGAWRVWVFQVKTYRVPKTLGISQEDFHGAYRLRKNWRKDPVMRIILANKLEKAGYSRRKI